MDSLIDGTMVDDTATEVSYFPADAWFTNRYGNIAHYNDTYHFTGVPGAYLTFRFNGSFVAYCSNLDTNHGDFFVSLDGRPVGTGNTYAQVTLPSRALFTFAVEPGPHVLNISNAATNTVMSLDYFITLSGYTPNDCAIPETTPTQAVSTRTADSPLASSTIPAPAASISTADPPQSPLPTSYPLAAHTTVGTGAIVGSALAGGALLLLLIGVAVLVARKRRGRDGRALVEGQPVPLPAPLPPPYSGSSARSPSLPRGKVDALNALLFSRSEGL